MFRLALQVSCTKCKEHMATESGMFDESTEIVPMTLEFATGIISFSCPKCFAFNEMKFTGQDDLKPHRKLGGIGVIR